jgi:hypothetical protein
VRKWGIAVFLGLAACVPHGPPPPELPSIPQFSERNECLQKSICQLIAEQGSSAAALTAIAGATTEKCSQSIYHQIEAHYAFDGEHGLHQAEELHNYDKAETERHALTMALQEAQYCTVAPKER